MSPTNALYCPERGDIVWLDFDPAFGHEQGKTRPALILSKSVFNKPTTLCLAAPITGRNTRHPFDVAIPPTLQIANSFGGFVRAHHTRSMPWSGRNVRFIVRAPNQVIAEALAKVRALFS